VLLFAALLLSSACITYLVWIEPLQQANSSQAKRFALQTAQLKKTRGELDAAVKVRAANKDVAELAALGLNRNRLDQQLDQARPPSATPLAQTLTELLRRREGLTLLSLSAVVPAASSAPLSVPSTVPLSAASAPQSGTLTRQGVEIAVAGSYAELTLYLQALETALPDLRWGKLTLKSSPQISELSLQLFVIGVTP
jgi:MSHA biogenesis protein MshJ